MCICFLQQSHHSSIHKRKACCRSVGLLFRLHSLEVINHPFVWLILYPSSLCNTRLGPKTYTSKIYFNLFFPICTVMIRKVVCFLVGCMGIMGAFSYFHPFSFWLYNMQPSVHQRACRYVQVCESFHINGTMGPWTIREKHATTTIAEAAQKSNDNKFTCCVLAQL